MIEMPGATLVACIEKLSRFAMLQRKIHRISVVKIVAIPNCMMTRRGAFQGSKIPLLRNNWVR
jgi:hypothetical protein